MVLMLCEMEVKRGGIVISNRLLWEASLKSRYFNKNLKIGRKQTIHMSEER